MVYDDNTIVIHTRVPRHLAEELKVLVSQGYYSNISDALRHALRKLIDEHSAPKTRVEKPKLELKFHEL